MTCFTLLFEKLSPLQFCPHIFRFNRETFSIELRFCFDNDTNILTIFYYSIYYKMDCALIVKYFSLSLVCNIAIHLSSPNFACFSYINSHLGYFKWYIYVILFLFLISKTNYRNIIFIYFNQSISLYLFDTV